MINKIKDWFLWLSPASIKRDTERLLQLAEEYKCSYNYSEIYKLKKQLDKEKNLRDAVLNHLDDMVWAKDLDGKYLMTNKSFREKFCYGLSDIEILGKTDLELSEMFKEQVGDENHTFGKKCKNSDVVVKEVQEAMKFLESGNINGKVMKLVVNKSPLKNYKGEMFGVCGSGRDVTEWHTELEKAIESSNACFCADGKALLLSELNKLEFLDEC